MLKKVGAKYRMSKIIKFIRGNNVICQNTLSGADDEQIMNQQVRDFLVEALRGGKEFITVSNDGSNINNWSMFGCDGDAIIIEDL